MYNEPISSPSIKIIAKHNLKDVFKVCIWDINASAL